MSESKGRPTPKRREVEQRRRRVVKAPQTRKEAAALQRELARERKLQKRQARGARMERAMPRRDAGPVRAFVRDYVDARRGPGAYFLPGTLVIFALGFSGVPALGMASSILLIGLMAVLIIDSRILGRAVVRQVKERFPGESTRGLQWYAASRSMQIRRWRLPAPRVNSGDTV